jgi:lipoprotein NlpI
MAITYRKYTNSEDFERKYWEIFNTLLSLDPDINPDELARNAKLLTEAGFKSLVNRELLATKELNHKTIK